MRRTDEMRMSEPEIIMDVGRNDPACYEYSRSYISAETRYTASKGVIYVK